MARSSLENSEWLTRKVLVDQALRGAGWRVCPFADGPLSRFDRCAVEEYPTGNGPADYALALDGRVLGVVGNRHSHDARWSGDTWPARQEP